jgi:5-methylcytosine-specific restriction endonuclease McrA
MGKIPVRRYGPPADKTYQPPAPPAESAEAYRERHKKYNTAAWRRLRAVVLSEEPLCRRCAAKNIIEVATQVHHIIDVAVAPELFFVRDNLEPLCASCHSSHTRREMNRNQNGSTRETTGSA